MPSSKACTIGYWRTMWAQECQWRVFSECIPSIAVVPKSMDQSRSCCPKTILPFTGTSPEKSLLSVNTPKASMELPCSHTSSSALLTDHSSSTGSSFFSTLLFNKHLYLPISIFLLSAFPITFYLTIFLFKIY